MNECPDKLCPVASATEAERAVLCEVCAENRDRETVQDVGGYVIRVQVK